MKELNLIDIISKENFEEAENHRREIYKEMGIKCKFTSYQKWLRRNRDKTVLFG